MAQITINIQTLDWTMGETVGLHLMLKKDSKARIAWGDGKVQVVTGKQKIISKIFVSPCTNSPRNSLRKDDSPPSLSPAGSAAYSTARHYA